MLWGHVGIADIDKRKQIVTHSSIAFSPHCLNLLDDYIIYSFIIGHVDIC